MSKVVIGMEIDDKEVKIINGIKKKGKFHIYNGTCVLINPFEPIEKSIKQKIKQKKIKGKKVSLLLGGEGIFIREVQIQEKSKEEVQRVIENNLRNYLPIDEEGYEITFKILGETKEIQTSYNVLLVAVCKDKVKAALTLVENIGLKPVRIGIALDTIANVMNDNSYILLQLQSYKSTLYLVEKGVGLLSKEIPYVVGERYNKTLLDEQIKRILQFYYSREGVRELQGVYLTGEEAKKEKIEDEIQTFFHMPTYKLTYLKNVLYPKKYRKDTYLPFTGLLAALLEPMSGVNFKRKTI
jgi:Tfp pilus assembly PilM family ATPase